MIHPIQWPDIIISLLIAEGFLYTLRTVLHKYAIHRSQQQVVDRMRSMPPTALDNYRAIRAREEHAPLG